MGVLYLSVELLFDLTACILGIILVCRAGDNHPKFYWGIIATCIGAVFMWENIGWLVIVSDTPEFHFTDLLNIEKMLKWYIMASIVALFPTASLLPGYLTPFKILVFLLPAILLTTIGLCYLAFNGQLTSLFILSDVFSHSARLDVSLRIVLFVFSVVTPVFFCFYPLFRQRAYRQINGMMYLFIGLMCLFVFIYCMFTLFINEFIFNLFGASAIIFAIFFSVQYLWKENPFSNHVSVAGQSSEEKSVSVPMPFPLFYEIDVFLKGNEVYTCPDYDLRILSETLQIKEGQLSEAVKSAGFSSFREYLNDLRLLHFCRMVETEKDKSIKELIFSSGFNSRSTFYRNFSDKYGVSPKQFVSLYRNR